MFFCDRRSGTNDAEENDEQMNLVATPIHHVRARELEKIGELLERCPKIAERVHADLIVGVEHPEKGRDGMTAEQVLRAMLIKQMNGFSYEALAFHLEDSNTFRSFCRLGLMDETPSKATLQRNIKKVSAETLEALNTALVKRAEDEGLESCRKVRTDCTVTETHIHEPSDSSLLWDGVRVLVRLVRSGQEFVDFAFTDHSRRAKRRMIGIVHCARNQERVPLYQDLVKVTEKTVNGAERLLEALSSVSLTTSAQIARAEILCSELRTVLELVRRVLEQTRRRVFQNESVPATEKVVSLFEPHTDIIVKDRRNTYYGHKLCVTSGSSGLVLDCVVEQGNPADSQLAVKMIVVSVRRDQPESQARTDRLLRPLTRWESRSRRRRLARLASRADARSVSEGSRGWAEDRSCPPDLAGSQHPDGSWSDEPGGPRHPDGSWGCQPGGSRHQDRSWRCQPRGSRRPDGSWLDEPRGSRHPDRSWWDEPGGSEHNGFIRNQ